MEDTLIILRYADGAITLTGWGAVYLIVVVAWIGILSNGGPGGKR